MSDEPKLNLILERIGPGRDAKNFQIWACRGEGRGCGRNEFRAKKKHCDDCVATHDEETIAELIARMNRGDA